MDAVSHRNDRENGNGTLTVNGLTPTEGERMAISGCAIEAVIDASGTYA